MTRIRYRKTPEIGVFVSPKMIAGNTVVVVKLDTNSLEYKIVDLDNNSVLSFDSSVSVQMLKINAKKALKSIGAVFMHEMRGLNAATFNDYGSIENDPSL